VEKAQTARSLCGVCAESKQSMRTPLGHMGECKLLARSSVSSMSCCFQEAVFPSSIKDSMKAIFFRFMLYISALIRMYIWESCKNIFKFSRFPLKGFGRLSLTFLAFESVLVPRFIVSSSSKGEMRGE